MWKKITLHNQGLILVSAATICWSSGGLFYRAISLDTWTISFWRSLFAAVFLAAAALLHKARIKHGFRENAVIGCAVVASVAISMATFLPSLALTSVASVAFIYATSPILATILGVTFLREQADRISIVCAFAVALGAAVLMLKTDATSGLFGNILALVSALAAVIVGLIARARPKLPLLSYIAIANALVAACAAQVAPTLSVNAVEMIILALFAFIQVVLSFILFTSGARLLPARDTALVKATEGPLSPLWVWMAFNEQPEFVTLVSGGLILMAVVTHVALTKRPEKQPLV